MPEKIWLPNKITVLFKQHPSLVSLSGSWAGRDSLAEENLQKPGELKSNTQHRFELCYLPIGSFSVRRYVIASQHGAETGHLNKV